MYNNSPSTTIKPRVRSEALRAATTPIAAAGPREIPGDNTDWARSTASRNIAAKGTSVIVNPLSRNKTGLKAHRAVRINDGTLPIPPARRSRKYVQRTAKQPNASVKRIAQMRFSGNLGETFQISDSSKGYRIGT